MSFLLRLRVSAQKRVLTPKPWNFYSTKTSDVTQETVKPTKSRTQKSSQSSPSSFQRTTKQSVPSTIWPKPREIPYQEKVANLVNLVGYVESPVRSEITSDGKLLAAIVISQKNSDRMGSLSIPVVFDGDLAHVVAFHVKQNDHVLVSGQLSEDPLKLSLDDGYGKLHVVAENLNFIEGFKRNYSYKKIEVSHAGMEIDKPGHDKIELYEKVEENVGNIQQPNQQVKEAVEQATSDVSLGVKNNSTSGSWMESGRSGYKTKDEELWRDLLKNPLLWWDYRGHKTNGLVKDRYPDFKQKYSGEGLWANSAPEWISTELGKLEFDVKVMQGKPVQADVALGDKKSGFSRRDDMWKNLVENPSMWWDNRLNKRNPKAPDFKHKETGYGVWLDQLPGWALSRLPPSKDGHDAVNGLANPQAS